MGLLQKGEWVDRWYDTGETGGAFKRQSSRYRGTLGSDEFPVESGRYQLIVSLACPWAHRTLIVRELKSLQPHIGVTVVKPEMLEHGWEFDSEGVEQALDLNLQYLYQLYLASDSRYEGRVTVPVLWDKQAQVIVNNESADILRLFNTAFNALTGNALDLYPSALRAEIDAVNQRVYDTVNNGVYKAGFATDQSVYEAAVRELFDSLDWLEARFEGREYVCGEQLTEADIRLFTTLVRFDSVYHGHFKCNLRTLASYPRLHDFVQRIMNLDGVGATVSYSHIKTHYYVSHNTINPTGIVPLGPDRAF